LEHGPVKGHVHRLRLIKRPMDGRANFDLLRLRVLNADKNTNQYKDAEALPINHLI
jgi:hypothetical protein